MSKFSITILSIAIVTFFTGADKRNPFGVTDVGDPTGAAMVNFGKSITLAGDKNDINAEDWTTKKVSGNPMFLDGEWYGRWNSGGKGGWNGPEVCKIKVVKDRVFILYGSSYLIEAKRVGDNKLVGGYTSLGSTGSTSPWSGIIVDGERIDGVWNTSGARWDFRRRAVRKLPGKKATSTSGDAKRLDSKD